MTVRLDLEELLREIERYKVKRRLKRAFARKPRPAKVRIKDEDVPESLAGRIMP